MIHLLCDCCIISVSVRTFGIISHMWIADFLWLSTSHICTYSSAPFFTPSHHCPVDPVNEEVLSENRKMITNQQLELYNEAAADVLNSIKRSGRSRVKLLAASRQAALETIGQSDDGLHLPESTRNVVGKDISHNVTECLAARLFFNCSLWRLLTSSSHHPVYFSCQVAMVLINSMCNKLLRPIDGSCCQTVPPPNFLQKMAACFFLGSALVFLVLHVLGNNRHRRPVPPDVESLEEKKPATAAVPFGPKAPFQALCRMGLIMGYFYLCDRADVFMKEQKFYTHSKFFIPLIYIFVLGVFYSENSKEVRQEGLSLINVMTHNVYFEFLNSNPVQQCFSCTDQITQPGTNRGVEGLDAARHPHLSHIWCQRREFQICLLHKYVGVKAALRRCLLIFVCSSSFQCTCTCGCWWQRTCFRPAMDTSLFSGWKETLDCIGCARWGYSHSVTL